MLIQSRRHSSLLETCLIRRVPIFRGTNVMKRIVLIIMDSVGCGDAPDADHYGDSGADTLSHVARAVGGLRLPNLGALGLGNVGEIEGVPPVSRTPGAWGRLTEVSCGKDTTTGHWELAGVVLPQPFPVYHDGFPRALIEDFERRIGRSTLGNVPSSGTEIIQRLGEEHIRSGRPIVYTSADSVFQIAAHEEIVPPEELYRMCSAARELLTGEHAVGRVIARPFIGRAGEFQRTSRRKDFSLQPPADTVLDEMRRAGFSVVGIGKIEDIFAARGLTDCDHTANNMEGVDATLERLRSTQSGLIFTNLVDFDALYGHRNDPAGYAAALGQLDQRMPELLSALGPDDLLLITADHGNDPTYPGTDHTRERVPLLVAGPSALQNVSVGTRKSFADVAATIAEAFELTWDGAGQSFANDVLARKSEAA